MKKINNILKIKNLTNININKQLTITNLIKKKKYIIYCI